jgi:hypothetical protein
MKHTTTTGAETMNTFHGYNVTRKAALPATEDATGILLGEYELTGPRGATYYTIRTAGRDYVGFISLNSSRTIKIAGQEWLPLADVAAAAN